MTLADLKKIEAWLEKNQVVFAYLRLEPNENRYQLTMVAANEDENGDIKKEFLRIPLEISSDA